MLTYNKREKLIVITANIKYGLKRFMHNIFERREVSVDRDPCVLNSWFLVACLVKHKHTVKMTDESTLYYTMTIAKAKAKAVPISRFGHPTDRRRILGVNLRLEF